MLHSWTGIRFMGDGTDIYVKKNATTAPWCNGNKSKSVCFMDHRLDHSEGCAYWWVRAGGTQRHGKWRIPPLFNPWVQPCSHNRNASHVGTHAASINTSRSKQPSSLALCCQLVSWFRKLIMLHKTLLRYKSTSHFIPLMSLCSFRDLLTLAFCEDSW